MNDENEIEYLLKAAGKRSMPAQVTQEQIKLSTQQEWRKSVTRHKRRRIGFWLAPAATAAAAVFMIVNSSLLDQGQPQVPVHLVSSRGLCEFNSNSQFASGTRIRSENACTMVLNVNQNLVMMDQNTSLVLMPEGQLKLESGRIYVDSESDKSSVVVQTAFGQVTDIGTLFEVSMENDSLRVTVREGIVKLNLPNEVILAKTQGNQGDRIFVDAQHTVQRSSVTTTGGHWQWAQTLQPPFHLEGRTADDLVHWASRVTGLTIEYRNHDAEVRAQSNNLSGGVVLADTISDTLPLYLKTAGLQTRWTDTHLVIDLE